MFVADERYRRNLDKDREGVAAFLREAILANAVRNV